MKKLIVVALVLMAGICIADDIPEATYTTEYNKNTEYHYAVQCIQDMRGLKIYLDTWCADMVKYNAKIGTSVDPDFKAGLISYYQIVNTFRQNLATNFPVILTGSDGVE
jgi:hypothetical protein